jgi:hypothetical protein
MSAPTFNILTQRELTIDLSRPAMEFIIEALRFRMVQYPPPPFQAVEVDNFKNTLHNLMERSETRAGGEPPLELVDNSSSPGHPGDSPETENLDLIGD